MFKKVDHHHLQVPLNHKIYLPAFLCTRRQNSCKTFINKLKLDRSSVNSLSGVIARQPDANIHSYDLRYDPNMMQKTNTERFQNFGTVKYNY